MTIKINKVAAKNAINWITRAWVIFKAQSGLWMQACFLIFLLSGLAGAFGVVGAAVYSLVYPFLMAGFYQMAFKANNGVESRFTDLFVAFSERSTRRVMLQLGLLGFAFVIAMSPLASEIGAAMVKGEAVDGNTLLTYLAASFGYYLFYLYAVPIIHFHHEQNILRVLKIGFMGWLNNPLPMLIFMFISVTLSFLTVFTLFIGMIIVVPWLMIAVLLSFNDLFSPPQMVLDDRDSDDQNFTFRV